MKIAVMVVGFLILVLDVRGCIYGWYEYDKDYASYWNLADKASTIAQKSTYVDRFVDALGGGHFEGKYDAIFLTTPDNSFDRNFEALLSLQKRLHEIKEMDVTSFQYQTAIQQITAQEQGEAKAMLSVFSGVWWKDNHIWLWDWIGGLHICATIVLIVLMGILKMTESF